MAASVARTVIRPHVAMINFPARIKTILGYDPSKAAVQSSSVEAFTKIELPTSPVAATTPIGTSKRGTGIEYHLLPERLRRKPLNEQEIEYINRGGPE